MTDEKRGGAPGAETPDIGAPGAPGRERRMTARRKQEAVLRVLRGELVDVLRQARGPEQAGQLAQQLMILDRGLAARLALDRIQPENPVFHIGRERHPRRLLLEPLPFLNTQPLREWGRSTRVFSAIRGHAAHEHLPAALGHS